MLPSSVPDASVESRVIGDRAGSEVAAACLRVQAGFAQPAVGQPAGDPLPPALKASTRDLELLERLTGQSRHEAPPEAGETRIVSPWDNVKLAANGIDWTTKLDVMFHTECNIDARRS